MDIEWVFTGVAVRDFEAATGWYERLFGRAADIVINDDEVMWQLAGQASIYLKRDAQRSGKGFAAIAVPDLVNVVGELSRRGIRSGPIEAVGSAGRKAVIADPEGNTIDFIQVN